MDKLQAMATFVRIVDRGSLTAAAESLRTSLPPSCAVGGARGNARCPAPQSHDAPHGADR
jgi:hypothetical protein